MANPAGANAVQLATADGLGRIIAQGENAPAEGKARVFDNDPRTKWLDFTTVYPNTQSSWLEYHYANDWPHVVTKYAILSANDFPGRDPRDWRLLGSNDDGTNWVTLDTRTNELFTDRFERREFNLANATSYGLYRLQIDSVLNPAAVGCVQLAEIELIGVPANAYGWNFGDGATSTEQNPPTRLRGPGPIHRLAGRLRWRGRSNEHLCCPRHGTPLKRFSKVALPNRTAAEISSVAHRWVARLSESRTPKASRRTEWCWSQWCR